MNDEKIPPNARDCDDQQKRCEAMAIIEAENSLQTILKDLRRQEKHSVVFNQYHRQFLNFLRDADWIACMKLPDTPRTTLTLLRNGWIERRATKDGIEYRITEAGLTELSRPR